MTDQERDPEATGPEGATDETEGAEDGVAELADAYEGLDDEGLGAEAAPLDADEDAGDVDAAADATPAAGAMGRGGGRSRERKPTAGAPVAPPSISEQAVHVNDRASAVFVIAVIGVFVAIFGYALLFGQGGFVTNVLATPTPIVTPAPTPAPTTTPTAAPTPAPTATAAPSATVAPSPSDAASPSPAAS